MKIDMVKPMPARQPAPTSTFALTPAGNLATPALTAASPNSTTPSEKLYVTNEFYAPYAPTRSISFYTTWSANDGPYVITGSVLVPASRTLTIEAGTTVFFGCETYKAKGMEPAN